MFRGTGYLCVKRYSEHGSSTEIDRAFLAQGLNLYGYNLSIR